ncbi:Phytochelatin synthase-domain-containing protein [Phascolomyces articulosus]|uniref:glutathione gamma-glutamylcysteinyltransferase n=1 Tax=Phascolomyces articulosus TaxID=60185 RepID=A0AAD5K9T7_9FUNG|nr:Phytochelatin synthase-domain-containing protein [Phascolomyces articulosus]
MSLSNRLRIACHNVITHPTSGTKLPTVPLLYHRAATMATARTDTTPSSSKGATDPFYATMIPTSSSSLSHNPYSRKPIQLVNFTSAEGKRLFRGAMDQGHAESFFNLMGNFSTQSSAMFGGVSSLAMALNALEIDPQRIWKGNWRWYSNELLETCSSKEEVLTRGMSFDEFTCLAQSHCHLQVRRATTITYNEFLNDLESATANDNSSSQIMIASYSRTRLGQAGQRGGHFSPIGGFNKAENMVLIMDVARGEYPSVWVNARSLYEAMLEKEKDLLGKSRGYFVLRAPGVNSTTVPPSSKPSSRTQQHSQRPWIKCSDCSRKCSKRQFA